MQNSNSKQNSDSSPEAPIWQELQEAARTVMRYAYTPYSHYPVGAAAMTTDGRVVTGCNVENASYGLGLCAECGLISELAKTGGGRLSAFICVDGEGNTLVPCGRCRQLLYEWGGNDMLIHTPSGVHPFGHLLPEAFGPEHLHAC